MPGSEISLLNVEPGLRHEIEEKVQVVDGEQRSTEHFSRNRKMSQITTREVRRIVRQALHEGPGVTSKFFIPQIQRAIGRKNEAVPCHASWQHAIEHIDAERD